MGDSARNLTTEATFIEALVDTCLVTQREMMCSFEITVLGTLTFHNDTRHSIASTEDFWVDSREKNCFSFNSVFQAFFWWEARDKKKIKLITR